jgi:hypothetical protein
MRILFLAVVCCLSLHSKAQTFDWWASTVNWDGVSHWSQYIITQPGYLGPNALPIPRIGNGSIDSNFSVSATGNFHFTKGDKTINPTLYANYCLVKNVIAFDLSWVPYEYFTMNHNIKTKRHVFSHWYYHHEAVGNLELNTTIQLLNKWRKNIHLALRLGYIFPTSSGLGMARYTDAPAYYFDISFGKPISKQFKWTGMLGFYCWQMISGSQRQNDALLFGTGAEWNTKSLRIQTYVAGYIGYLKMGDKPVVFRARAEKKFNKSSLILGFQQGLNDFQYSSAELGMKYRFK